MATLIVTVWLTSLLGSLHCAGMCGAFVAMSVAPDHSVGTRNTWWHLSVAYHGGRLMTYLTLGALAGAIGAAIDLGGSLAGLSRISAILAGVMMIVFGSVCVTRYFGVRLSNFKHPELLQKIATNAHRAAMSLGPVHRAMAIGLLTTLLPCGWLWAFVVLAAGTAHVGWGVATMAAFWAGTLPVMVSIGAGAKHAAGKLGPRLGLVTSLAVILVGLLTVTQRVAIALPDTTASAAMNSTIDLIEHTHAIGDESPACCNPDEH